MRHVDVPAERAERPPIDRVAVDRRVDVRPGDVDGMVDAKGGRVVDAPVGDAALDDLAVRVDEDEVLDAHHGEAPAEGVDPEAVGADGIADRQMAS